MGYASDTDANALLISLTSDVDFTIPEVDLSGDEYEIPGGDTSDLYKPIVKLTNADLTEGTVDGTGTFDVLMSGLRAQLEREYKAQRITGAEYTKAYTALVDSAIQNSVQFLLGRDQAFWQAQQAQIAAITAKVQLETAKVQLAALQLEALTSKANYALTKLKLASEDIAYGVSLYQLNSLMPAQLQATNAQTALVSEQTVVATSQNSQILQQTQLIGKQILLTQEQTETARASTLDVRSDGQTVVGSIGKQKDLYSQQITSYQRDAEVKAAKFWSDSWITQKTIDEGLVAPPNFTNDSIDQVLSVIKSNNGL